MEKITIGEFEIMDLGADSHHYFPGFGAYGSGFDFAICGQGLTVAEALEDALSQMGDAYGGIWDVEALEATEAFKEAVEGFDKLPSRIPLVEEGDGTEEAPEGEPNPDWYHYVGIRWSAAE